MHVSQDTQVKLERSTWNTRVLLKETYSVLPVLLRSAALPGGEYVRIDDIGRWKLVTEPKLTAFGSCCNTLPKLMNSMSLANGALLNSKWRLPKQRL